MNTIKNKIALSLITSILAITLLSGSISIGNVYATGGLDDEEEEEAILELQTSVQSLQESISNFELNLSSGQNNIQANCPVEEIQNNITEQIEEIVQNITEEQDQPVPECPLVPEQPNNNQSSGVIPPFVEPEQNNETAVEEEPEPEQSEPEQPPATTAQPEEPEGCEPIPEPEQQEQNQSSVLEPIICPSTGDLLGYTNTTSGEQLPVSAGGNETAVEEEPEPEQPAPQEPECEPVPAQEEEQPEPTFNAECFCYQLNEQTGELNVNSTKQ